MGMGRLDSHHQSSSPKKKDAFRDFASGSFSPIRAATEQTFNINEAILVSNHVIEDINVLLLAQVCI